MMAPFLIVLGMSLGGFLMAEGYMIGLPIMALSPFFILLTTTIK
jgi:hypothetical protein